MPPFTILATAADASAPSQAGYLWIAGLLAALPSIMSLFTLASQFVQRREFETLKSRVDEDRATVLRVTAELSETITNLRDEMPAMERRLNDNSEQRAEKNHERTNEVLAAVSKLTGEFEQLLRKRTHGHTI